MQAHLETIIANSRRSRSDWNEGAKALLRPLAPGRTVDSFASLPIEFDLPRRYDHEWMEQVVASAEHEVGLDAHNTGRPETNR